MRLVGQFRLVRQRIQLDSATDLAKRGGQGQRIAGQLRTGFVGLVLPRSLSWLGGILLLIVAFFLGWLLALSWPVLNGQSKFLRTLIVIVVVLLALFKFVGIL